MIINELEGFYGRATEEQKQWVAERIEKLGDEEQQNFLHILHQEHKKGFPSIFIMKGILERVTGKKQRTFYWSVCQECGCEYDFNLPMCPSCYKQGLECRIVAVKVSELNPPAKVIRYNKPYFGDGKEKICYDCEYTELSYCYHFGQTDWNCRNLQQCKCASCCVKEKNANKLIEEKGKSQLMFKYAKPLNRGNKDVL